MERRWISAKEAAQYLNLHIKTIYRLVSIGTILYSKIPSYGIRIDKVKLDQILEAHKVSPADLKDKFGEWIDN